MVRSPSKAAPHTRAPRLPAGERRQQILDAAIQVFARQGYAGTGTADIAREAGIGEPTIYRYYSNKRDLYVAAVEQASGEVLHAWQQIADDAPDPMAALQRLGVWYYERMQRHPERLLLRFRSFSEAPDEAATAVAREEYRASLRFVESLFKRAQSDGQIDSEVDVRALTWLFMSVGSMLDMTQLLGLGDELTPGDVMRLAELLGAVRRTG